MCVVRKVAICGESDNHACTPRITAKKPITERCFHLFKRIVTTQFSVQICLCESCSDKVIRAPDKWHSYQERILFTSCLNFLQSLPHIPKKLNLYSRLICHGSNSRMSHV